MTIHDGECRIQCKSVDGGKVSKTTVRQDFERYGSADQNGKYRSYVFVTNGEFTEQARRYMKSLREDGWSIDWIENVPPL